MPATSLAMYSACILAPTDNLNPITPIAIFHFDVTITSKISKSGVVRSAIAGSAYRAGAKLTGLDGKVYDYSKRKGVAESLIIAPESLKDISWVHDRQKLWCASEKLERRKDSQLYREVKVCLQRELSPEDNKRLVVEFCKKHFTAKGMIADIAFHGIADNHNPHAHIMLTMRRVKPDGSGFGNKARDWNSKNLVAELRQDWEDCNNQLLQQQQINKQISGKKQQCPKKPHISRSVIEMEKRGIPTQIYEKAFLGHFMGVLEHNLKQGKKQRPNIRQKLLKFAKQGNSFLSNLQKKILQPFIADYQHGK